MAQRATARRNRSRTRARELGLIACAAATTSLVGLAVGATAESGGAEVDVLARYPGPAAEGVPGSAHIHVELQIGWFAPQKNFDIVVTGPEGQIVDGRSDLGTIGGFPSPRTVLSFTPEEPLTAGWHSIDVHHRRSPSAARNVIDSWQIAVRPAPVLSQGAGGSILLIAREGTRDSYLAEILRAEGITGFHTVAPEQVTSDQLAGRAVVLLGAGSAGGGHIPLIESWVRGGGELITMQPEGGLAAMAGLTATGEQIDNASLAIDTTQSPGAGLTAARMQFRGEAVLYSAAPGTRTVASLRSGDGLSGPYPAVTLTSVGDSGGQIAAFSYDLPTSVMYTRQGHPEQAGKERDGVPPIRPNDLFFGSDDQPDPLDLSRIGIPQADEQMRLLTNLLVELHGDTSPLPRFWYLPNREKAAVAMTVDDHGTVGGTRRFFERMLTLAEPGCDVDRWECPRATSWLYPLSSLTPGEAEYFSRMGFDLGAHVDTGCSDWTRSSLHAAFVASMLEFREKYASLPGQTGHRLHCVAYSDWLGLPGEQYRWGIRLDMNFYNWPPDWIQGRPGYITGSALPMRFSDENGRVLDVFQQESHLVNETWQGSTRAIEELITAAIDERGYFGVFGTHSDFSDDFDRQLMAIADRRGVPMVSAQQLLDFTDGRHASKFTNVTQVATGTMTFVVEVDERAEGLLCVLLPMNSGKKVLASVTVDGEAVDYEVESIKGVDYALFEVVDAGYEAVYR